MPYVDAVNLTPANGGEAMYELKQLLLTAGWTVVQSTDNVSVANTDLWVSAAIANTASVWIILQNPGSSLQLAIQRQADEQAWYAWISRTGAFDNTGTLSTIPAAPDRQPLFDVGHAWFNYRFFPVGGTYRYHIVADNQAPYSFWSAAYPIGGGLVYGTLVYDPVLAGTAGTGDTDPYTFIFGHQGGGWTPFAITYLYNNLSYTMNRAYLVDASVNSNFVTVAYSPPVAVNSGGSLSVVFPGGVGTNPYTSGEDLVQALVVRHNTFTAPVGYKGISTLIRFVGTNRATGDTITVGADTWIVMQNVALPWPTGITPDV